MELPLRSLFAVVENYPDMRATENVRSLQGQLATTEGMIASARDGCNAPVRDYNTSIATFPRCPPSSCDDAGRSVEQRARLPYAPGITVAEGDSFMIADSVGDVRLGIGDWFRHLDTRFVSGFRLEVDERSPDLLTGW